MSAAQKTAAKPATAARISYSPVAAGILQRKCACGGLAGLTGKCEKCQSHALQRKLSIGSSNDPLEQEADRVADQVMAPANSSISRAPPRIQRFTGESPGQANEAPASVDSVLASSGSPLERGLRQDMERRFSHDFSQVRIHYDSVANESVRDVNARAYTVGRNVVFGRGGYTPETIEGKWLLAHELSHVVQQNGGSRNCGEGGSSLSTTFGHSLQRAGGEDESPQPPSPERPQLPETSLSTQNQIRALMEEHPGLSEVNAKRALRGPPGSDAQLSGKTEERTKKVPQEPAAPGKPAPMKGPATTAKVPDIDFVQFTREGKVVLRREIKAIDGTQGRFNAALSTASDQLIQGSEGGQGGEVLIQVPEGTNARSQVNRFKGAGSLSRDANAQRLGRYRSIKLTIVDPSGTVLFSEPLEFPPLKAPPIGAPPEQGKGPGTRLEETTPQTTSKSATQPPPLPEAKATPPMVDEIPLTSIGKAPPDSINKPPLELTVPKEAANVKPPDVMPESPGLGRKVPALGEVDFPGGRAKPSLAAGRAGRIGAVAMEGAASAVIGIVLLITQLVIEFVLLPMLEKWKQALEDKERERLNKKIHQMIELRTKLINRQLRDCYLKQIRAAEAAGKKLYAKIDLRVRVEDTSSRFQPLSKTFPDSPFSLDVDSVELGRVTLVDTPVETSGTELTCIKSCGVLEKNSLPLGGNPLWERTLTFSIEAPSSAALLKEFPQQPGEELDAQNCPCFIATACYGSLLAPEVETLRRFRDRRLIQYRLGRGFVHAYYFASPPIARWLERHDIARAITRSFFVGPIARAISRAGWDQ